MSKTSKIGNTKLQLAVFVEGYTYIYTHIHMYICEWAHRRAPKLLNVEVYIKINEQVTDINTYVHHLSVCMQIIMLIYMHTCSL